ncbi:hypothetical protein CFII64_27889, partial [Pseudomonas sp. CFII64]
QPPDARLAVSEPSRHGKAKIKSRSLGFRYDGLSRKGQHLFLQPILQIMALCPLLESFLQ